jgi:hypothetical protein
MSSHNYGVNVITDEECHLVVSVTISFDTEFTYMHKAGKHETNQRLSIGCKVILVLEDGSFRLIRPLLEPDFHVIIKDWLAMAKEQKLKIKLKSSKSWAKTINVHPQNTAVDRLTERDAIVATVKFFTGLKTDFPRARKFVLRGHYATTVDIPAICALALRHCKYDVMKEWDLEDSKYDLKLAYKGLSIGLWNVVEFEAQEAAEGSPIALIWAHEEQYTLAHKSAGFDAIAEMAISYLVPVRRPVDITAEDQQRYMTKCARGGTLPGLGLDKWTLGTDLYSLLLDRYSLGTDLYSLELDKYSLGTDLYSLELDKYSLGTDLYSLLLDKYSLGTDLYSLGLDKYSLGTDLYSLLLDKYSLGTDKFSLGLDKYSLGTDKYSVGTAVLQWGFGAIRGVPIGSALAKTDRSAVVAERKKGKKLTNYLAAHAKGKKVSQFVGVTWMERLGKWRAEVRINGKRTYLGLWDEEEEAGKMFVLTKEKNKPTKEEEEEEEEAQCEWVSCDKCSKWRKLAPGAAAWPEGEGFECRLNWWNLSKATCTAQDDGEEEEVQGEAAAGEPTAAVADDEVQERPKKQQKLAKTARKAQRQPQQQQEVAMEEEEAVMEEVVV